MKTPINIETIFQIRSYPQYNQFEEYECVICQRQFPSPLRYSKRLYTCSKYCQNVRNSLIKRKGYYILCKVCDKPIYVMNCNKHLRSHCSRKCKSIAQTFLDMSINSELKTGRKKYYGPNWLHQRDRARERDNYKCQNTKCGITEIEYGQELSVHHKTPFVYFKSYIEANQLDNLICFCERCHRKEHTGNNHALKFNPEKIVFVNDRNKVGILQREKASEVVSLLLNTDMDLTKISEKVGLSYSRVRSIYIGKRWRELYEKTPRDVRPREMTLAKEPINSRQKIKKAVDLLLNTDLSMKEILEVTGVSKTNLYRIYNGKTNKDLYEKAPREVRPRREIYNNKRKTRNNST
jgi:5-methylcytosine-specific restriction endonuclease McrA